MVASKALMYGDQKHLKRLSQGAVTDLYYYNWQRQRYRARFNGTYWRYVYNGDRVMEETNDTGGTLRSLYTTESGSYYEPLVHMWRARDKSRFPLYDGVGSVRMQVDNTGTITDSYLLDAFGRYLGGWGSSSTKYRYGGAWGYITDPSGLLQLGARCYWPEIGRFIQQDPVGDGINWYGYVGDNPVTRIDPSGEVAPALAAILGAGYGVYKGVSWGMGAGNALAAGLLGCAQAAWRVSAGWVGVRRGVGWGRLCLLGGDETALNRVSSSSGAAPTTAIAKIAKERIPHMHNRTAPAGIGPGMSSCPAPRLAASEPSRPVPSLLKKHKMSQVRRQACRAARCVPSPFTG